MSLNLLKFPDALTLAGESCHLLLGNGFSISWKPNIFKYESLYEKADFKKLNPNIQSLFENLRTKDFELVMKALLTSSHVVRTYKSTAKTLIQKLENDAQELKNLLVNTIASNHPESPNELTETEYSTCIQFLNNFKHIYTLNYDLLLYWTIMHNNAKTQKANYDDGFRTPDSGKAEYVTWEIEKTNQQNVFYLHGALHLFDEGSELQKYTWVNTGIKLIDQIKSALSKDYFPLFVSEGTSKEKKERIVHSNYLSRSFRSFSNIKHSLFIYGHSLAENDAHILDLIPKGKLSKVFISIYGDPNSKENKKIIKTANTFQTKRTNQRHPLEVHFYDAAETKIWR
jgi:hypothetical protein